jgi:hypothetical protein
VTASWWPQPGAARTSAPGCPCTLSSYAGSPAPRSKNTNIQKISIHSKNTIIKLYNLYTYVNNSFSEVKFRETSLENCNWKELSQTPLVNCATGNVLVTQDVDVRLE